MISFTPRQACLWIHRYTGLAIAAFLVIASLTGALLAFHHELDDMFNQKLASIETQSTQLLPIAELHDKVITTYPEHKFSSMPTSITPDKSVVFSVDRNRGRGKSQPKAPFQEERATIFSLESAKHRLV